MERGNISYVIYNVYIFSIAHFLVGMSLTNRTTRVHILNLTNIGFSTEYNFNFFLLNCKFGPLIWRKKSTCFIISIYALWIMV